MNYTSGFDFLLLGSDIQKRIDYSFYAITGLYILIGTPSCLWVVTAIITSSDMRHRLRNQLVCALCLSNMIKTTIGGGLLLVFTVHFRYVGFILPCTYQTVTTYFRLVVGFVGGWYIIILLLVYISQIMDYNPSTTLRPTGVIVGKSALLVGPWAVGIVLLPVVGSQYKPVHHYGRNECLAVASYHFSFFRSVDYFIPMGISFALLVMATILYHRRFPRFSSSLQSPTPRRRTDLIRGRNPRIDDVTAYIVVVCIDIVCRFVDSVTHLDIVTLNRDANQQLLYHYVGWMMVDVNVLLTPWAWLLLDDVRQRIKTWRPWYRNRYRDSVQVPVFDPPVTYSRHEQ